jgi:hypothetical protein
MKIEKPQNLLPTPKGGFGRYEALAEAVRNLKSEEWLPVVCENELELKRVKEGIFARSFRGRLPRLQSRTQGLTFYIRLKPLELIPVEVA